MSEDELKRRLADAFQVEAEEHVRALSAQVQLLEKAEGPQRRELVHSLFREAHNFKGAARLVGLEQIEDVCHAMEDTLSGLKSNPDALTPEVWTKLFRQTRELAKLQSPAAEAAAPSLPRPVAVEKAAPAAPVPPAPEAASAAPRLSSQVRVSTARLDTLLLEAEELISAKLALSEHVHQLQKFKAQLEMSERSAEALRLQARREEFQPEARGRSQTLEQLARHRDLLTGLRRSSEQLIARAQENFRHIEGGVDALLEETREALMLPLSTLTEGYGLFVRELAESQGKRAELVVEGGEIELGKRALEELKDPLTHLIRNSVDHGIETPAERRAAQKPESATIRVAAAQIPGGRVVIEVSDDGRGVDLEAVAAQAARTGLSDSKDEAELLDLIFHSGFSTRSAASHVSGRGLGLSIARENVERMGGGVSIQTEPGRGTRFRIEIPASMLRLRGVVARIEDRAFVIPSVYVERAARVKSEAIRFAQGRQMIEHGGAPIALLDLASALGLRRLSPPARPPGGQPALILGSSGRRSAFLVDEIVQEQDIVVKAFGRRLQHARAFSGATLLGSGEMALVLNGSHLLNLQKGQGRAAAASPAPAKPRARTVLLVEDSITSRTLLRTILQTAGYEVKIAVDGMEGMAALKLEKIDLVISDVQMPRMDGIELTKKIRETPELRELPVILITSLGSREDKERGVEAGANAYIVKGALDQENLLQTIRRLAA